jgi:hypothetical protein
MGFLQSLNVKNVFILGSKKLRQLIARSVEACGVIGKIRKRLWQRFIRIVWLRMFASKMDEFRAIQKILAPPIKMPTEEQHKIAWLTWHLNDIYYDDLLGINMVRTQTMRDDLRKNIDGTPSLIERDLQILDSKFDKWRKSGDKEIWEVIYSFDKFKQDKEADLSDIHCGDCTAVPSPCLRCHAEDLYNLPNSRSWNSKSEGWAIYCRWKKLVDEFKP